MKKVRLHKIFPWKGVLNALHSVPEYIYTVIAKRGAIVELPTGRRPNGVLLFFLSLVTNMRLPRSLSQYTKHPSDREGFFVFTDQLTLFITAAKKPSVLYR